MSPAPGTMTDAAAPVPEKRMARDYFFPTPVYCTDLAQAQDLNAGLVVVRSPNREAARDDEIPSEWPELAGIGPGMMMGI